jgi:putative transcriptional regulator
MGSHMSQYSQIKTGSLLMSEPFILDSNFRRSAILLCDHRPDGTVGFILNRPLDMNIHQLVADFPIFESEVFFGGPVATDTIHYVHNVGEILDGSIKVSNGIYWGGDFDKLKFLIQAELIKPNNIRFFVGYSGWDDGQLADEMAGGTWFIAEMHANYLFKSRPSALWRQITHNIGNNYTVIAQMPDPVCLN